MNIDKLSQGVIHDIISLAWCDKTSFEMIKTQTNIAADDVKKIMKRYLKRSSYRVWRDRVTRNKRKHEFKNKGVFYYD
ncbi:TIGR03643 family protein [Candidatus Marinamargulisbacteria bacterium SCGC AG-343-D04]|nr:TIGR03643 family protein [Candidatus Marinamargulisbacteria bacterium SCGC AG-343-D04]